MVVCKNPNCEMENADDAVFCKYCGRRLKEKKSFDKRVLKVIAGVVGVIILLMGAKALFSGKSIQKQNDAAKGVATQPADGIKGYKMAYVKGSPTAKEVYINNADGTSVKVTNSNALNLYPSLSPDGKKVIFERKEGKVSNIYVTNANGIGEKKLAEGHAPTWSNNGSLIIFYNKNPQNSSNVLYTIKPDGTGLQPLTNKADSYYMARYSPDGSKIAIAKNSIEGWGIYTIKPDTSGSNKLSLSKSKEGEPAWSEDGNKIAYSSERDGNREIYTVDMNKNITRLTNNPLADLEPSWTPDGKVIFTREENATTNLYIVDADGKNEKLLIKDAGYASVLGK